MPPVDFPLLPEEAHKLPTWRAAYADRTAELMAKIALWAYEPDLDALRKALGAGGFSLVNTYDRGVTQGFLARSPDFAVLAFRGSDSFADWRQNLQGRPRIIQTKLGPVRVHGGFKAAFDVVEDEIKADLAAHIPQDLGLYITGHSLGAAVAQIASAALERDNLAALYTFGAPRVGDGWFDQIVKCPHYRIVNGWDFVTTLPTPMWTPYRHSGDARLLTHEGWPPLRRDRNLALKLVQNIIGLTFYILGFDRLFSDHRLESYLVKLRSIRGLKGIERIRIL
jgi:Lipase (class 3)